MYSWKTEEKWDLIDSNKIFVQLSKILEDEASQDDYFKRDSIKNILIEDGKELTIGEALTNKLMINEWVNC